VHTHFIHAPEPESGFPAVQSVGRDPRVLLGGQRGEMDRGGVVFGLRVSGKRGSLGTGMRKRAGGEGWGGGGVFFFAKKSGDAEGCSGSGDSSMRATEKWKNVK
jgi:hypothetical protein